MSTERDARSAKVRFATYNIHRAFGGDRRFRPERIASVIRGIEADAVALQEVDSSLRAPDGRDLVSYLADETGMRPLMGPTLSFAYGQYGNAFLLKNDGRRAREWSLSFGKYEPRGALGVEATIAGRDWFLCCAHLGLRRRERLDQIDRLLKALPWDAGLPIALMGDFNEWWPWSRGLAELARFFPTDAPAQARLRTFPAPWPRFALDRIYLFPEPPSARRRAWTEPLARIASDHLPLIVEFPSEALQPR